MTTGRPPIGTMDTTRKPIGIRLGDLRPLVDRQAQLEGCTRAEMVRRLVQRGLNVSIFHVTDPWPFLRTVNLVKPPKVDSTPIYTRSYEAFLAEKFGSADVGQ